MLDHLRSRNSLEMNQVFRMPNTKSQRRRFVCHAQTIKTAGENRKWFCPLMYYEAYYLQSL